MKTLLTIKQQNQFLSNNWQVKTLKHKWSTNGYGNSKIFDSRDNLLAKADGCGYDRFGTVIGETIINLFPELVHKLAKSKCTGRHRNYKKAKDFYGLFYNSITGKAWVDGGCGISCMEKILNKIGFSLEYVGETKRARTGEQFYQIVPITKQDRKRLSQ